MSFLTSIANWWRRPLIDPAVMEKERDAMAAAPSEPVLPAKGSRAWAEAEAKRLADEESSKWRARCDAWEAFDLSTFDPGVTVREYLPGRFLCREKLELPIQFIESIEIKSFGKAPSISAFMADTYSYRREPERGWVVRQLAYGDPHDAVITITMNSGQTHVTFVHPKALEITHAALNAAWKGVAA